MDESSLRSDPSRRRVLNTPVIEYSEGKGKRSRTIFGFMTLNGKDVAMVSDTAKTPDMGLFLELVRWENGCDRAILSVMDNARIHTAHLTGEKAEGLGIFRTLLPPYSPDIQPIEFGWKDLKRELSGIFDFDLAVCQARTTALKLFNQRKQGYTAHWMKTFIHDKS